MVQLPTSHLIPAVNQREEGKLYHSADRMAIAPEHTLHLSQDALQERDKALEHGATEIKRHVASIQIIHDQIHTAYKQFKQSAEELGVTNKKSEDENYVSNDGMPIDDRPARKQPSARIKDKSPEQRIDDLCYTLEPWFKENPWKDKEKPRGPQNLGEYAQEEVHSRIRRALKAFSAPADNETEFKKLKNQFLRQVTSIVKENLHECSAANKVEGTAIYGLHGMFANSRHERSSNKNEELSFEEKCQKYLTNISENLFIIF